MFILRSCNDLTAKKRHANALRKIVTGFVQVYIKKLLLKYG